MSGKRRKFTPEFRAQAVRLVTETGRPVAHVAAEIGIKLVLDARDQLLLVNEQRPMLNQLIKFHRPGHGRSSFRSTITSEPASPNPPTGHGDHDRLDLVTRTYEHSDDDVDPYRQVVLNDTSP